MTDDDSEDGLPGRVRRAAATHDGFERDGERLRYVATPFEATVDAAEREDGRIEFRLTVRLPTLSATTADEVAAVVEDGWYETFELRVAEVGAVTEAERELSPTAEREGETVVVRATLTDLDGTRGLNDAASLADFVEGTYVQGIVPGYDYEDPVASVVAEAHQAGGSDGF